MVKQNKNLFIFNSLIIALSLIYCIFFQNWLILIFTLTAIIFFCYKNFNWKRMMYLFVLLLLIISLYLIVPQIYKIKWIIENIIPTNLNVNHLLQIQVENKYNEQTANFLKLMFLNKVNYHDEFTKQIIDLNIIHLFVISGIHIDLINQIINKSVKNKRLKEIIKLLNIISFMLILNFTISTLRIFISIIARKKLMKFNPIERVSLIAIILLILFIHDCHGFSYILTFLATLTIGKILLKTKNKILILININIYCFLATMMVIVSFNKQLNLFSIINSFIFGYLILFTFLFLLLIYNIPGINTFVTSYCHTLEKIINLSASQNEIIEIVPSNLLIIAYYYGWFIVMNLNTKKIKYNNKYE